MKRKKIVIIGGGSRTWTSKIVKDMLLSDPIYGSEIVLYDIDKDASDLVASFLNKLNGILKTESRITSTDDREQAFRDADYFIITISTGGLKAMAHDLAIPEEYGIYHTVGDTSGPGGWARLLRNFEAFVSIARDINRYARGAMVLNYSNPMAGLTKILVKICESPVVGLCHGLFANLTFIKDYYKLSDESEISINYGGINHFIWSNKIRVKNTDVLQDLKEKVIQKGFTSLLESTYKGNKKKETTYELASALFRETGLMPYLGDRHTCEFFPCYITDPATMKELKLKRTSIEDRIKNYRESDKQLREFIRGDIPHSFLEKSRETASDIISAHITGRSFIDVGNVPNIGQVSNLPAGTVVETAVRVDKNGFSPIAFGELPQPVLGFTEPHVHTVETALEACFENSREKALQALRLDPLCSHLTGDKVREMGNRLIEAHKEFIQFQATPTGE